MDLLQQNEEKAYEDRLLSLIEELEHCPIMDNMNPRSYHLIEDLIKALLLIPGATDGRILWCIANHTHDLGVLKLYREYDKYKIDWIFEMLAEVPAALYVMGPEVWERAMIYGSRNAGKPGLGRLVLQEWDLLSKFPHRSTYCNIVSVVEVIYNIPSRHSSN
jgi:hypothetical protein